MPVQLASPSGVAPPGILPATYRYRTSRLAPGAAPCYAGFFARHDPQEPKWEEAGGRLVPVQLASPSGVAPPGVLPATYRYRTSGTRGVGVAPGAAPCYAGFFARHTTRRNPSGKKPEAA